MMKRILSFLLCLIMVCGVAVPTVQAEQTDDIFVADDTSNIIVGDNVHLENVTVNGSSVSMSPNPTQPQLGSVQTPTASVLAESIPASGTSACPCDQCGTIAEHRNDCLVKAEYHKLCAGTAEELFAVWGDYTADEQDYMLQYLEETAYGRYVDLMKLLNAPTGSATETYTDGTTVSVQGIPEDGTLTVQEATDAVKDIVSEYVANQEDDSVALFAYDVSVQDGEGSDWQPEASVKMELEVPGTKLHKYAKVYVVHVDDSGAATTIEARVTEEGKIAFETPGFSTFAGFTVDFEYDGEAFSINGLSEILVSEVMDTLKMPLYIEDVADVAFTDESLVSVTPQEGDWLLTSLKAFKTTESLTLTMNDGTVYQVQVTDDSYPGFYVVAENGTYEGEIDTRYGDSNSDLSGGDGVITILLDSDGQPQINSPSSGYDNAITNERRFLVSGAGTLYLELQHAGIYGKASGTTSSVNTLNWDLMQIRVTGGATLVIRLGGYFDGDETINLNYKKNDNNPRTQDVYPMFDVDDGNLFFRWSNHNTAPDNLIASDKNSYFGTRKDDWSDNGNQFIPLYLNGNDYAEHIDPANKMDDPLILIRNSGSTKQHVFLEDLNFKNAKYRAIRCYANELENLYVKDCYFDSTVQVYHKGSENGGAAINIEDSLLWDNIGYRVDIYNFTVEKCKFYGVKGNDDGGAIESNGRVYNATIKDCVFQNLNTKQMGGDNTTEYASYGGAVAFKNYTGKLIFSNTEFLNCKVRNDGGAVYLGISKNANDNWSKFFDVTFQDCYFYQCLSRASHGGALAVHAQVGNLNILGCKFEECKSLSNGAAVSIQGREMNPYNAWQEAMDDTVYGTNNTLKYQFAENGSYYSSVKKLLVDDYNGTQTQFLNCKASTSGGAIEFAQNTYVEDADINDTLIQGCKAVNNGSAIFMSSPVVETFDLNNVTVKECSYIMGLPGTGAEGEIVHGVTGFQMDSDGQYIDAPDDPNAALIVTTEASGTIRSTGGTTAILTMTNCTVTDNFSYSNGGGLYWNACYDRGILAECYAVVTKCTFARNIAMQHGGGIYCESKLTVRGCQIYNNYSDYYGGGIAQQVYNNSGRLLQVGEQTNLTVTSYTDADGVVTETNIYGNYSDVRGGGISIRANPTASIKVPEEGQEIVKHAVIFNLQGANIYNNTARLDGGGVSFMEMRDQKGNADAGATWTDEQAIQYNNAEVESYDKSITISNGIVYGNRAGIDQDWSDNIQRNKAQNSQTWKTTFTETNTAAGGNGGGIYMLSSKNTTLAVNTGYVYSNTATQGNGGGIYMSGVDAVCTVSGGVIGADKNNTAKPNNANGVISDGTRLGGNGGGIAVFGEGRIVMTGGYIVNNTSDISGGGIAVHGGSTMYLTDGHVENNTSHIGGGISLNGAKGDSSSNEDATKYGMFFNGGFVMNNKVTPGADGYALGGGICISAQSTMKISKGEITGNTAATDAAGSEFAKNQEGGGIAVCQTSTMDIDGGKIAENKAYDGGGLCIRGTSTVNMSGSVTFNDEYEVTSSTGTIEDNTAAHAGGGAYLGVYTGNDVNRLYMKGGWIFSNEAGKYGGGVYVGTFNGFYLSAGSIEENIATNGGGVYSTNSVVEITDGVMKQNEAKNAAGSDGTGGAIYCTSSGSGWLTVKGGQFLENKAKGQGGGAYANAMPKVEISKGTFQGNLAKFGGGMFLNSVTNATFSGSCMFTKNYSNQGAGLFIRSSDVTIDGGTFSYNECKNNAYYVSDYQRGGGILVDNNNRGDHLVTINGGSIDHNKAPEGGGLWIRNNMAADGYAPKVTIYGGIISHNNATNSGGGIFIHGWTKGGTELKMYGGEISYNTCGQRGGGINADNYAVVLVSKYTNPTTNEVTHPVITHNTGGRGGGIFVCYGAELTVDEGFITFNHAKGTTAATTAYGLNVDKLYGVGGGIGVATGVSDAKPAKFTLRGDNMAIYGNTADFGADDVFSDGNFTLLDIPEVLKMNMAGYKFMPEAWFEDYPKNDTSYRLGTVRNPNYNPETNSAVYRYRGSVSINRFMIDDDDLDTLVNIANKYICITLGIPSAVDDTVVCDYGLNVSVDVIANDNILSASEINKPGILSIHAPVISDESNEDQSAVYEHDGVIYGGLDSRFQSGDLSNQQNKLAHGKASLIESSANILYEMDASSLSMTKEDSFYYAVWHKGPKGNAYYYYAKVTVVPATSIYYEDNCGAIEYINDPLATRRYGYWRDVTSVVGADVPTNSSTDLSGIVQDEDRPGFALIPEVDMDNLYGYDDTYDSGDTFSMGSAKWVRVNEAHDAAARFTFTGTGYDIISFCSNKTGMIMVDLYEGDQVPEDTFDSSKYIDTVVVDTFYGCTLKCYKYTYTYISGVWSGVKEEISQDELGKSDPKPEKPKENDVVIQYLCEITPSKDSTDVAYQVPILKRKDLAYGTYTAEIYIAYSPWMEDDRHPEHYCDFYLDAIRVYDPANNGATSETVKNTYLQDGEGWPVYQELRNMFITQEELTNKPTTGIVFMDGTDYSVGSYKNYGANNEVYLAKNQTIGFKLDELKYTGSFSSSDFDTTEESIVANIHLGIKSLNRDDDKNINSSVTITGKNLTTNKTVSLNLTPGNTEMFYDITALKNSIVTIKNTGNSIISLTSVKITHTEEPVSASSYSRNIFTMDDEIAQKAVVLAMDGVADPVPQALIPKYPTLSFEGEIRYNVYFEAQGMADLPAERFGLAIFSTNEPEGTLAMADALINGAAQDGDLMVVSTKGIPAKKLGDMLYFKVFAMLEDGEIIYSPLCGYSAQTYAKGILKSATASQQQKALAVAMLNYGAAAQTYFGYNTDSLMSSILTDEQQALVSGFSADSLNAVVPADAAKCGSFVNNDGFVRAYPTVSFEAAFQVQYYFYPAHTPVGNVTFCFWSQETYESCETLTVENADAYKTMTAVNGEYMGVSPEIAAKELDETLYVAAFYEAEGETYCSGVLAYSLAHYCKSHAGNAASDMNAFANAAAIYGCAAKSYFAQ